MQRWTRVVRIYELSALNAYMKRASLYLWCDSYEHGHLVQLGAYIHQPLSTLEGLLGGMVFPGVGCSWKIDVP